MTSLIRLLPAMLTTTTLITVIIFTPVPVTAAALAPPPPCHRFPLTPRPRIHFFLQASLSPSVPALSRQDPQALPSLRRRQTRL